jgi:nucleotide-binding universal stress UspA family protein
MRPTIIVAVDASKNASHAGDEARRLAADMGAELVVVRVTEIAIGRFGRLRLEESPVAAEVAQAIVRQARADGVEAREEEHEAMYGQVAHAIAKAAEGLDARMIVVGTRGRSEVTSLVLGSTAHRLLHETRRPVLVVPLP